MEQLSCSTYQNIQFHFTKFLNYIYLCGNHEWQCKGTSLSEEIANIWIQLRQLWIFDNPEIKSWL